MYDARSKADVIVKVKKVGEAELRIRDGGRPYRILRLF